MRRAAVLVALILVALALVALRPPPRPGPLLRDFEAYYAAGASWTGEIDPYSRDVWRVEGHLPGVDARRDEILPFVGPPYTLPLFGLLGALPFIQATPVWGAFLALAALVLAFCIARLAQIRDVPALAGLLLLGAAFGPLTSALALGQLALPACAGVVATTAALQTRVRLIVPIVTALAAALQPNIGCALIGRLSDRRASAAFAIAAIFALSSGVAALGGFAGVQHYLTVLRAHAAAESTVAIQVTVAAVTYGFGASDVIASRIALGVAVVVILTTAWLLRSVAYTPASRVAIASAALPLVLPFAHEHDLLVTLFPAVLVLRAALGIRWIVAACATMMVAVDWLGLAQRPQALTQAAVLAFAAAFAIIALSRPPSLRAAAVPLGVAVCVVVAGLFGAQHPVGVWPYALPSSFHAPLDADVSTVWHLEQVASGLATPNFGSALLRGASVAGCALLWGSSLVVLRRSKYRRS
ncbi:MAG: hypothetical protein JO043_02095 [Candidatus Eremiobacteraeota bacterium]|nr:hypothetical protein [Candidatus Eremiobacteraeota bacterium]